MPCYRTGGCGPYEGIPCNECPARNESYLQREEFRDLKQRMADVRQLQLRLQDVISGSGWSGRDADTVLADVMGVQGDSEMNGSAVDLCDAVLEAADPSVVDKAFTAMTGKSLSDYAEEATLAIKSELNSFYGKKDADGMKTVGFTVQCMATHEATMRVPADLEGDELAGYIREHLDQVGTDGLSYVPDSDELDEESVHEVADDGGTEA